MSSNKFRLDSRVYYGLAVFLILVAAANASSLQNERPLIESNVVNIDANELKELRQTEADAVFTIVESMENGYLKSGEAKEKIQDYKYNAKSYNGANGVETQVNQDFISFCNSAIDCTNEFYYGINSERYVKVYGEMETKKDLI